MERGTETGFLIFLKNKCYLLNGKVYKYKQKRVFQEAALELKKLVSIYHDSTHGYLIKSCP